MVHASLGQNACFTAALPSLYTTGCLSSDSRAPAWCKATTHGGLSAAWFHPSDAIPQRPESPVVPAVGAATQTTEAASWPICCRLLPALGRAIDSVSGRASFISVESGRLHSASCVFFRGARVTNNLQIPGCRHDERTNTPSRGRTQTHTHTHRQMERDRKSIYTPFRSGS